MQTFVWARRRRGSARGALKGVPEAVAGSGCWAAPDLGLGQELARRIASRGFTVEESSELINYRIRHGIIGNLTDPVSDTVS